LKKKLVKTQKPYKMFNIKMFQKLPIDIQRHIMGYSYPTQTKALTNDIKSFVADSKCVFQYYEKKYGIGEALPWIFNDFCVYWSNFLLSLEYAFQDNFLRILSRRHKLCKKICATKLVLLYDGNIRAVILIWGLMTSEERKDFIAKFCN
jgi:hypothetical protein